MYVCIVLLIVELFPSSPAVCGGRFTGTFLLLDLMKHGVQSKTDAKIPSYQYGCG